MKRVPQYGEMVPGRLKMTLDSLNSVLWGWSKLFKEGTGIGFMSNRKKWIRHSPYDLLWWNRLEAAITRSFLRENE